MKKIALFTIDLKHGGAQRAVSNIAKELQNLKYDVTLLLFDATDPSYEYEGKIIDLSHTKKYPHGKNWLLRKWIVINNYLRIFQELKKQKKKENFDVVFSFLLFPNLFNALTEKYPGKAIVSVRAYIFSRSSSFVEKKIYPILRKIAYSKADLIVAVSSDIKTQIITEFNMRASKIKVIYNGYPISEIENKAKFVNIEGNDVIQKDRLTLITVGRLVKQKGHIHLIRIMAELVKEYKEIQLLIYGQGELQSYLQESINEMNLNDYVYLMGYSKKIYPILNKADIFLFPSFYEGFPNALLEAMVCKLPIITADCQTGPREIVGTLIDKENPIYEYGIMVPTLKMSDKGLTNEEIIFKNQVELLINDLDLRKKMSERAYIGAKRFSINEIIKDWIELI